MRLRIEKAIYGGDMLARMPLGEEATAVHRAGHGKAVFVADTLPGELVEAHILETRQNRQGSRGYARAALKDILEASPERIPPACPYVPVCGGCQYQHAAADFQVGMKLGVLKETMARAHLNPAVETIRTLAGPSLGYRNRIRMHIQTEARSEVRLCYRERATHRDVRVQRCPVAAPILERGIEAVTLAAKQAPLEVKAGELEFFTNGEEVLLSIYAERARRQKTGWVSQFAGALQAVLPELAGIRLFSAERKQPLATWGSPFLVYPVGDLAYRVSAGSFFQINRFLLPDLLSAATGGHTGKLAWDLYAGAGFFSRALDFEELMAVEADVFSAGDLVHNLMPHQRTTQSTTQDFLVTAVRSKMPTPDLVLVDPPRSGLGAEICRLLARVGAGGLVYVSCDPATLARDLQALLQSGYRIQTMTLVDLFPQTFHIETVTFLEHT